MGLISYKKVVFGFQFTVFAVALCACSPGPNWIASSGPSRESLVSSNIEKSSSIPVFTIDDEVTRRVASVEKRQFFSEKLVKVDAPNYAIGPGDLVEVSIWEAPPAALFGVAAVIPSAGISLARPAVLPEQMVAADGSINIPFAGAVSVGGKSPQQVERDIARRLLGKANQPQVMVRVTRNATSNVTVVGEVSQSLLMPLTAKGERLLDAIAAAGGVRQPVSKVVVQMTRGSLVQSMPLERVIQSPKENVLLAPGDVVTVHFQPLSFTVLGAAGKNEEINFEAQGISLAQALARSGGLQDTRADARGVFIFRFEDRQIFPDSLKPSVVAADGRVPVVYQLDMKDPASFLVAQNFPIRNKDVLYVANAPSAELQKFLNILTSSIFSVNSLINLNR